MIRKSIIIIAGFFIVSIGALWIASYGTDKIRAWEFSETSQITFAFHSGRASCFVSRRNESQEPQKTFMLGRHIWAKPSWYSVSIFSYDARGTVHSGVLFPVWIAFLLSVSVTMILFYGPLRRRRRRKHNQCIQCGYSLTGLPEPRCPECGHKA